MFILKGFFVVDCENDFLNIKAKLKYESFFSFSMSFSRILFFNKKNLSKLFFIFSVFQNYFLFYF